jgi:hypothetical protein
MIRHYEEERESVFTSIAGIKLCLAVCELEELGGCCQLSVSNAETENVKKATAAWS